MLNNVAAPTSPVQLLSGKTPWYPRPDPALSHETKDALRRAFDNIYQIAGTLLPIGVQATGRGTVLIPATATAPATVPSCQITFQRAGLWLVTGVWSIQVLDAGDLALPITGSLLVAGLQAPPGQTVVAPTVQQAKAVLKVQAQPVTHSVAQTWSFRVNANATARLQIQKDPAATGTHTLADGSNSSVLGVWCGL
jgi:hypothetical protein